MGDYIPLPVTPTKDYPYSTDEEWLRRKFPKWRDEQNNGPSEADAGPQERPEGYDELMNEPGIIEAPTMDMDNPFRTSIHEFDGHYYILPSDGESDPVDSYRQSGEHLGRFKSLEDAQAFEQKYLGEQDDTVE